MELNNMDNFDNWSRWKKTMSKAVNLGEAVGMAGQTIDKIAYRIGDFLSSSVDPENREQRVLQELWRVGNDSERKILAKLIVNMVQSDIKH